MNEIEDETKVAMEAFFAGLPGGVPTPTAEESEEEDQEEEEEERKRDAQRHAPRGEYGLNQGGGAQEVKDPAIGGAFGRTKPTASGSKRNWARK